VTVSLLRLGIWESRELNLVETVLRFVVDDVEVTLVGVETLPGESLLVTHGRLRWACVFSVTSFWSF
jgi:hypothetical protein